MTEINLDRMLHAISEGQWSADELDWSAPMQGLDQLSALDRRRLAHCLLFVSGLERLGSEAFRITAEQESDARAKAIFQLVALDEDRHADVEVRMAKRLGYSVQSLPRVVRSLFRLARHDLATADARTRRLVHENISMQIVLFELGLDSFFTPLLKERLRDPLHDEVVRRIELDESRHLAMDYWLLERKGQAGGFARTSALGVILRTFRLRTIVISLLAFVRMRGVLAMLLHESRIPTYRKRVLRIRSKAPSSVHVPALQYTLRMLGKLDRPPGQA